MILEVDGEEVFRSTVDRFAYEEKPLYQFVDTRSVHEVFYRAGQPLRMLHASNGNRGLVEINEERPYRFVYTLSDALGNTSKVRFTVQGQKTTIVRWNIVKICPQMGQGELSAGTGLELVIRKECSTMTSC